MLLSVFSFGCYPFHINEFSKIDSADKTVFVPLGEGAIVGELKEVLRDQGWKVFVEENRQQITEGTNGEKTELKTQSLSNARYRLLISSTVNLTNFAGTVYDYEISFVDNKTGQEAFTLHGRDEEGGIRNHFEEALKEAY